MNINKLSKSFLLCLIISSLLIPNTSFIFHKVIGKYKNDYLNSLKVSTDNSSWTHTWNGYGSSWGIAIETDSLDNIYVAGTSVNEKRGLEYIALLKFNTTGNLLWNRTWRDARTKYSSCSAMEIDNLDNIYLTGEIGQNDETYLLKYDSFGNKIWNISCSLDSIVDIAIDSENYLYLLGSSKSMDIFLVKYNSSGSYLGNYTLGSGVWDESYMISIDSADNIYIGGEYNYWPIIFKLNSSGAIQWNYTFMYVDFHNYYDLTVDSSNDILTVDSSGRIFKFNSLGTELWNKTLNRRSIFWPSIITDSLDNIYIVQNRAVKCISNSFFAIPECICTNIYLMKCDSTGNLIWEKRCTGCSDDRCNDITLDSYENIYLCGTLVSKRGCENMILDILIIKNPKEYNGICFIFYYDLFFVIIISLIIAVSIILLYVRRKKKLNRE